MNSNNTVKIVIVAAFIVLLSIIGWLLVERFKMQDEKEELVENAEQLETEIKQLETELTTMQDEISRKDLELEEKNKLIADKDKELEKKRRQIDELKKQGKINAQQAEGYLAQINTMQKTIQRYEAEIEQLKAQLAEVTTEKEQVTKEKEMVENKNQQLSQEKEALQGKVNVAAILKAANFRYVNVKNSGKESDAEEEFRAGRLDKLKVQFSILDNAVAATGNKDIFVQIINPDGTIAKDIRAASGTFSFEGSDAPYTFREVINYERTTTRVTVIYQPTNQKFIKGTLKVRVFADGFQIGESSLNVK
jgi:myosin heavy subunit